MEISDNFKNKKVLVLGLGLNQGGVGAARFFARAGAVVKVTDLKTKDQLQTSLDQLKEFPKIEYVLGEHRLQDIDWADLIIRNPALKPDNQYLKYALEKGKRVEMDLGIFLQFVTPDQIIGITGTKGKSTTASLIYEVLKAAGKEIVFAGNIRKSVLEILPEINENTLVILELSSFQLQAFEQHKFSPRWAVITNIYPDHLNYHQTMENYIEAKRAIVKYQGDPLKGEAFLNRHDDILGSKEFAEGLPGKITYFGPEDLPKNFKPLLPGRHNLSNISAVLAVIKKLGVDEKLALQVMANFKGVEYRLQLVKEIRTCLPQNLDSSLRSEINSIKIYNDSTATTPQATIEALKALPNSILICGGMNKNLDYHELAEAIQKYAKAVYFLEGDATENLKSQISNLKLIGRGTYNNLQTLLTDVLSEAQSEDVVLFSPGATSFNLFQNEFDRGEKFNQAVEKVASKNP